jgi:hypothetical protein
MKVAVTDHALLRYIERGMGVDIELIRSMIEKGVREAVLAGANSYRKDGLVYRITEQANGDRVITTVLTDRMAAKTFTKPYRLKGDPRHKGKDNAG